MLDAVDTSNDEDVSKHIESLTQLLETKGGADVTVAATTNPTDSVDAESTSDADVPEAKDEMQSFDLMEQAVSEAIKETTASTPATPEAVPVPPVTPPVAEPAQQSQAPQAQAPAPTISKHSIDSTIRVDVHLLDNLMNQVGELVLARNQMQQFSSIYDDRDFVSTTHRLNLITSELQEGVMKTRMQPIGNVWSKFPRLVRDLSKICEKQVRIEMHGEDKGVLRSDAESFQSREVVSIVVLRAYEQEFGLIVDHISDTEEIVVKPLSNQLKSVQIYSGATIMGDGRVALILDVFGLAQEGKVLGVGREQAGSDINDDADADSAEAQTLLIIGLGDKARCALPMSQVDRLENIPATKIESSQQHEVTQYRGKILPLVRLSQSQATASPGRTTDADGDELMINVVVFTEQGQSFGLIVDRILDIVETKIELSTTTRDASSFGSAIIHGRVLDLLDLAALTKCFHIEQPAASTPLLSNQTCEAH